MAEGAPLRPRLIVFSDTSRVQLDQILLRFGALGAAAEPKSVLFVLRDYALPLRARLAFGAALAALARRTEQCFGVADRADLARYLGAVGLHLPERGVTSVDARRFLGPGVFLTRACHDPSRAADSGASAVLLSPICEPRKGRPALGLAALTRVRAAQGAGFGLYALGGVDSDSARACLTAGASGAAVIGAALAPNPEPLLTALGIHRA